MELFSEVTNPFAERDPLTGSSCPVCGSGPLARVAGCEAAHWLCRSCGRCWERASRSWRAVDPVSCPGCATQPRTACLELLAETFPRFGGLPDDA